MWRANLRKPLLGMKALSGLLRYRLSVA